MRKDILFYLLAIPVFSFSQTKEKKAVVVFPNNDTIHGFVDDKEWLTNPAMIRIKESKAGDFKEYEPSQLKSVHIEDGDYYESYLIKIDDTPSEFDGASFDSSQIKTTEKRVFLLVQFSNPELSLYSYRYKTWMHYYIKKGNDTPEELIYRKYTVRRDNGIFEMEDKRYINQLNFLTAGCSNVAEKISGLPYTVSALTELFKDYYKTCGKTGTAYLNKQPGKGKFSVGLLAGISKSDLSFKSDNPGAIYIGVVTRTPLKTKSTFAAGIRINYLMARAHQKLSLSTDIYYNQFTASTFEYTYNNAPNDYETKTLTISPVYLHGSFGLRYFLNRENPFRPFLQAGISESVMLSNSSEAVWEKHASGTTTVTREYPFPDQSLKKSAFGEFLGAGLSYKRLALDYRYHNSGSLTFLSLISSSLSSNILFFSYQLTP